MSRENGTGDPGQMMMMMTTMMMVTIMMMMMWMWMLMLMLRGRGGPMRCRQDRPNELKLLTLIVLEKKLRKKDDSSFVSSAVPWFFWWLLLLLLCFWRAQPTQQWDVNHQLIRHTSIQPWPEAQLSKRSKQDEERQELLLFGILVVRKSRKTSQDLLQKKTIRIVMRCQRINALLNKALSFLILHGSMHVSKCQSPKLQPYRT